jgi:hypothetical protein
MTAETAPQLERQVRAQGDYQQMVRYGVVLAVVVHLLLHDRRFHVAVITGAIGAVALADLIKNNQARPVRRVVHWYNKVGASHELARGHPRARQELARAGQALEAGKRG